MFTFNFTPEIEDQIFEWAAYLFPHDAPHVRCRRVQTRVEYIIYESLFFCIETYRGLPEVADIERFTYTLQVRPAEFFASHVRNIFFTNRCVSDFVELVLAKCTGVRNLVLWILTFENPGVGPMVLPLSSTLVTISTSKVILNEMAASGIIFPNVEYVGLVYESKQFLSPLNWLPKAWKMQMHLGKQPWRSDMWLKDAKMALATAHMLIEMHFIVDWSCMIEVQSRKDELGDDVDVFITDYEDGIERWRLRNVYDEFDI